MSRNDPVSSPDEISPERVVLVRHHLQEISTSQTFAGCKRAQDFLYLVVGHALKGEFEALRERQIGAEMFGRPISYDTGSDSVVRVKATEVRKKLAQYYLETAKKPAVRIELPSGSYVPKFYFEPGEREAPSPSIQLSLASEYKVVTQAQSGEPPEVSAEETAPFTRTRRRRSPRLLVSILVAFLFVGMIGYVTFRGWFSFPIGRPKIRSIAILPLENLSGDPGQEYFTDGMTEELINDLGQVSTLRVISLTSSMSYKGTQKKLPEIARELGVDGVVEGAVLRDGSRVRISAQLIDAKSDKPIWAHTYVRDLTSVLGLQGEVAQAIADEISIEVTPQEQARLARARPVNTDAQDLYLQGMLHINAGEFRSAIRYFQKAIDTDPHSAQAHAALAACYGWMGEAGWLPYTDAFSKQKSEAITAIELDDSLPEAHVELANASMNLNWDWPTAALEFQRAQELNPNSASIHDRYAVYLERTSKLPEAVAEIMRAVELDPVSGRTYLDAGFTYYFSRQYDQALAEVQRIQALGLGFNDYPFLLGDIYDEKGMYAESIKEFLKLGDKPHALGHLGNAYARSGNVDKASKTILQLEEHVRKEGVGRYEIALVYAGLGKRDEAFTWLEEAYKAHDEGLTNLEIDPCIDPLRSDQRFDDLVSRVGLRQ